MRAGIVLLLAPLLATASGCDRIKEKLYPPQVDNGWKNDSTLLAQAPTVLLRVVRSAEGTRAVPIASVGAKGLRALSLTGRGWRALDVQLLHNGRSFVPYRNGTPLAVTQANRCMWEGETLDSLPGCRQMIPAAAVSLPDGVELLTSGSTALRGVPAALSDGELQEVLNVVTTLVAPSAGVPLSQMGKYRRTVAVVGTGATRSPTIVVSYDDPQELPDSVTRLAERPRQLILVLDKGAYGYKPSLTLKDVSPTRISRGDASSAPSMPTATATLNCISASANRFRVANSPPSPIASAAIPGFPTGSIAVPAASVNSAAGRRRRRHSTPISHACSRSPRLYCRNAVSVCVR